MEIIDVTEESQIINSNPIDIKSELTYHCTVEGCTSHFFTHVALRKHVETVHKTYTFACHLCGKRYRHKFSLKEHLATHKGKAFTSLLHTVGQKVEKSPNKELTSSTNCFITKLSKHHGGPKYTFRIFLELVVTEH